MKNLRSTATDVLVFGEINLDILVEIKSDRQAGRDAVCGCTIDLLSGGNTWNHARTLSVLGNRVEFVCTSAEDDIGAYIARKSVLPALLKISWLRKMETLSPRFLAVHSGAETTIRAVHVPPQKVATRGQRQRLRRLISDAASRGCRYALFASSIERVLLAHAIRCCRRARICTVGTVSSAPSATKILPFLQDLDVLIVNHAEACILKKLQKQPWEKSHHVVVTDGATGCSWRRPDGALAHYVAPKLGRDFVNSLGAGDAFTAFLLDCALKRGSGIDENAVLRGMVGGALLCTTPNYVLTAIPQGRVKKLAQLVLKINKRSHER